MAIALHQLKSVKTVNKKRKRVGRGNASGHGTYSTRGVKGQKSRSGVTNLKRLGMKKQLLSIPKSRGFKSRHPKFQVVNLKDVSRLFSAGQTVNPVELAKKNLVSKPARQIKILGQGELTVKQLTFAKLFFSDSAVKAILAADGKIIKTQ